jgi:hypothetical protein
MFKGEHMQEITLGGVTVPVYPQRWAYLANRAGKAVQSALARGDGLSGDSLMQFLGEGAFDVLAGLIPNLEAAGMTRERFMDEQNAPTIPEIRSAFKVACDVNEISDLPGMLGKALGPEGTRFARASLLEQAFTGSATSPSPNGGSPSESSTATGPTPVESTDSPSLESTD